MDKKAIALILIGVIFGIEGIGISLLSLVASSELSQLIAAAEHESTFFEQQLDVGFLQMLSSILTICIIYSIAKIIIGIFCIAVGATELFETSKKEQKKPSK